MFSATDSTSFRMRLLAVALLGAVALLLVAARTPAPPPVYSLATVWAGLSQSPSGWVGRTVRVRALAGNPCLTWMHDAYPACIYGRPALLEPSAPNIATALPLRGAPPTSLLAALPSPLLAALNRLHLARWLAPAPQQIRWGAPAIYRVRLQVAPFTFCGAARCYEALLLDAAPDEL